MPENRLRAFMYGLLRMGDQLEYPLAIARPCVQHHLAACLKHGLDPPLLRVDLTPLPLQLQPQDVRRPDGQDVGKTFGDTAIDLRVAGRADDHVGRCLDLFLPVALLEHAVDQPTEIRARQRRLQQITFARPGHAAALSFHDPWCATDRACARHACSSAPYTT